VFKLDRLTRSGVADTFEVVRELTATSELIAPVDNLYLRPKVDGKEDLVTTVILFALGLAAQIARSSINENIAAARVRVEAEGGTWGRPVREPDKHVVARELLRQGRSVREVAQAVGLPRSTVGRILSRNPVPPSQNGAPENATGEAQETAVSEPEGGS